MKLTKLKITYRLYSNINTVKISLFIVFATLLIVYRLKNNKKDIIDCTYIRINTVTRKMIEIELIIMKSLLTTPVINIQYIQQL